MKRCYFIGMSYIFDIDLIPQLSSHCEALVQQEDEIEFWFFSGEHYSYISSCLALVVGLKSKYPEKDLKIVRVYDPTKKKEPLDWYGEVYDTRFPCCLVDRYIYAPLMDEGVAKIKGQFVQQANKVERWILRQMDLVFAYYYPNLEDSVIAQIEYAQKSCKAEVVRVYTDETEQFIQEKAEELFDDRTRMILSMLKDGIAQREIGKTVGVSTSRIGQIAHKAARSIREALMKRFGGKLTIKEDRICSLIGLTSNCNAFQLSAFEALLVYISDCYYVREFWIDEKSCETAFGAILAKFCVGRRFRRITAKVIVHLEEDEVFLWDQCINKYVPPFGSVVNLGIESTDEQSFFEEMVRQSSCLVTDFAGSQASTVKELCAKAGDKYLFDLSRDSFSIDDEYI